MEGISGTVGETLTANPNYCPYPTLQLPVDTLLNTSFDTIVAVQQVTETLPDIRTTYLFLGDLTKTSKMAPLKMVKPPPPSPPRMQMRALPTFVPPLSG